MAITPGAANATAVLTSTSSHPMVEIAYLNPNCMAWFTAFSVIPKIICIAPKISERLNICWLSSMITSFIFCMNGTWRLYRLNPKHVPVSKPHIAVDKPNNWTSVSMGFIDGLMLLAIILYPLIPNNMNRPYPVSPKHKPKNSMKNGAKNGVKSSSLYLGSI